MLGAVETKNRLTTNATHNGSGWVVAIEVHTGLCAAVARWDSSCNQTLSGDNGHNESSSPVPVASALRHHPVAGSLQARPVLPMFVGGGPEVEMEITFRKKLPPPKLNSTLRRVVPIAQSGIAC